MGCLSKEEREEVLKRFWEAQERSRAVYVRHLGRVRLAASEEEDPYRKRLLAWAAEHWGAMEALGWEGFPGLYGTAYAALPEDLRVDMGEGRSVADPDRAPSAEEREGMELRRLRREERERTGPPCSGTEARLKEVDEGRRARGEKWITEEQIKEVHREISRASGVHDPADLSPG